MENIKQVALDESYALSSSSGNEDTVENSVVYVILLVSSEIQKYTQKMFLNQWENYSMSTKIMKSEY